VVPILEQYALHVHAVARPSTPKELAASAAADLRKKLASADPAQAVPSPAVEVAPVAP
jgi:hypothetical protein